LAGDPRNMAVDAQDQMAAFEEAIRRTLGEGGIALKAVLAAGRKEHRAMHRDFMSQRYANASGNVRALGRITTRWVERKLKLGGRVPRGQFTGGLERQIKNRRSFIPLEDGFDIDITAPNMTTRVPLRVKSPSRKVRGGRRSKVVRINDYLRHYATQKAPGIGALSNAALDRIAKARNDAEERQLRRLRNIVLSAAKGGTERLAQVRLILKGFAA
jgi:hypothetical protein